MSAVSPIENEHSEKLAWRVCFVAALFFFYEFIQGTMFGSISQDVMRSFHIGVDKNSYLSSIYYVSNVIFLFPAGIILDRFSTKRIIIIALGLCILGTFLFAFSTHLSVALFCRFITGIGSAFCFLACISLASRWFAPERMALVSGLIVTMAMTGGMVAQAPMMYLLQSVGWRMALCYDGLLGIAILILIVAFVKDSPGHDVVECDSCQADLPFWASLRAAYFNEQNVFAAIYTCLMNAPVAVLGAMAGSMYLMQAHQFGASDAALISSMIFVGTIFGGPTLGAVSDRLGRRKTPMIVCNLLSLLVLAVMLYLPLTSLSAWMSLFFLLGFFTSAQVISYPLVAENNPQALTATAVSVVSILTIGGYVILQNAFAYILQANWDGAMLSGAPLYSETAFYRAMLILPAGFMLALLGVFLLKETYCKRIEQR